MSSAVAALGSFWNDDADAFGNSSDVYLNDPTFVNQLNGIVRKACVHAGKPGLLEDALQEAWAVCVRMSREYDPSLGVPFVNYVRSHVHWTALHYCKSNSGAFSIPDRMWRTRRRNGSDDLSAAIYTVSLGGEADEPDDAFSHVGQIPDGGCVGGVHTGQLSWDSPLWRKFDYEHLRALVQRLEPNEQRVITRFGEGLGCADIAREIGVTRQRVHQVLKRALTKIRGWWEASTAA
jgi:RNA polymerase sigma factor (sigma-70 family)